MKNLKGQPVFVIVMPSFFTYSFGGRYGRYFVGFIVSRVLSHWLLVTLSVRVVELSEVKPVRLRSLSSCRHPAGMPVSSCVWLYSCSCPALTSNGLT